MLLIPKHFFSLKLIQFLQKIYDKRDYFDFDIIVNFQFLDGDVASRLFYGVYIYIYLNLFTLRGHLHMFQNYFNRCNKF